MATRTYTIKGTVLSSSGGKRIKGLRVETWDKDLLVDDFLAEAVTDARGTFSMKIDAIRFHELFLDRKPDLFFKVYKGRKLVASTEDSILWNVKSSKNRKIAIQVNMDGEKKPKDRKKPRQPEDVPSSPGSELSLYKVAGKITSRNSHAVGDLFIRIVDKEIGKDVFLAETTTQKDGSYQASFNIVNLRKRGKEQPDLQAQAFTGEILLGISEVHYNASHTETLNIELIEKTISSLPSEYDALTGAISIHYKGGLDDLREDEERQDISHLAGKTGWNIALIMQAVLASQYGARADGSQAGVEPVFFYALLRGGLPQDYTQLLNSKRFRWEKALRVAINQNVIASKYEKQIPSVLDKLETLAVNESFQFRDGRDAPMGVLLGNSGLKASQQKQIVEYWMRDREAELKESFWQKLADEPGIGKTAGIAARFAIETYSFVFGHLSTLQALQKIAQQQKWSSVQDLVRLGREDWLKIVKTNESMKLPQGFDDWNAYAETLFQKAETAFPSQFVAHRLISDNDLGNNDMALFFSNNPNFDLKDTPVEHFFQSTASLKGIQNPEALKDNLKRTQRILRIVPNESLYENVRQHLVNGFDSAMTIVDGGKQAYMTKMRPVVGESSAELTFANAETRVAVAEMVRMQIWDHLIPLGVLPGTRYQPAELPSWAQMFGSLTGCTCEHCRSVLSPAAYLADLMKFLMDARVPSDIPGARPMLDVLLSRRPDLARLQLNCENANTALPYIDLVNDVLEDAVLDQTLTVRQTENTAENLRAEPAYEQVEAYTRLSEIHWPWELPFSLSGEKIRLFSRHLGLARDHLMVLFGQGPETINQAALGLSDAEWALLTTPAPGIEIDLNERWGLSSGEDPGNVSIFLVKSGLSYSELQALLGTWFLSEEGIGPVSLESGSETCDLNDDRLIGLTNERLDQIHRFIRLSRKLGWSVEPESLLDDILHALGRRRLDARALADIVRLQNIAAMYGVGLKRLVTIGGSGLTSLLNMTEQELLLFADLIGKSVPTTLEHSLDFLELGRKFRNSGFGLRELAYVLLGRDQAPAVFAPLETELKAFLRGLFDVFTGMRSTDSAPPLEAMITENVAAYLGLTSQIVERFLQPVFGSDGGVLEPALLSAESDASQPAMVDLVNFVRIDAPDGYPDVARPEIYNQAARVILRLDRVKRLVLDLGLDVGDLNVVVHTRTANGFIDFNELTVTTVTSSIPDPSAAGKFAGWLALVEARQLRNTLPKADQDLFDLLQLAVERHYTDSNLGVEETFEEISAATGWSTADLVGLVRVLTLAPASFLQVATYDRLRMVINWLRRFKVDVPTLSIWADPASPPSDVAESMRLVARMRQSDDLEWRRVLTSIMDSLRERKRDALVAYLLHHKRREDGRPKFKTNFDIYGEYLIDPMMNSCALTSRIVQANASIQLFIQRSQMGLEAEVALDNSDGYWQRWEWMKNYRVWEANRKVFLYPENWIEPDLRDGKSPFFNDFETELLQDEVRGDTVERLLRGYLEKLDTVARLDVRGLYLEEDRQILHVFGCTRSIPNIYYYRRRLKNQMWTAWEKVDLDIEGEHLIPVFHEGRMLLFWPILKEKKIEGDSNTAVDDRYYWDLVFAWSEYKDGRWQAKQTQAGTAIRLQYTPRSEIVFKTESEDGDLFIWLYQSNSILGARLQQKAIPSVRRFRYDPCRHSLVEAPPDLARLCLAPARAAFNGMRFEENHSEPVDEFSVIYSAGEQDSFSLPPELFDLLMEGGLGGAILFVLIGGALVLREWEDYVASRQDLPLLWNTPGQFELLPAHQDRQFLPPHPFFFGTNGRTYIVTPQQARMFRVLGYIYNFETFYHPYVCDMIRALNRRGSDGLYQPRPDREDRWLPRQLAEEPTVSFSDYLPTLVKEPYPREQVDFSTQGAYSMYNWELFFHIPLMVAQRLNENHQFEDAEKWFRYIFDPTDISSEPHPANVWKIKPFFQESLRPSETIDQLLLRLAAGDENVNAQVQVWLDDPFNPHAIARLRILAYMRSVVMKYLDHLITWADDLFQQNTRESINTAAQLYVLAAEILHERPQFIRREDTGSMDFLTLRDHLDDFSNALVDIESSLPVDIESRTGRATDVPPNLSLYFCIPFNEKLLSYWDVVADRLFKIRNCMDIEGSTQQLPLFEPPIDPALLVRARAAGLDLRQALRLLQEVSLPHYRYSIMQSKAMELCSEVRLMGAALLAALEKQDAEELSLLRARHEESLLSLVSAVRKEQIQEAKETLEALKASLKHAEQRRVYYTSREFMNPAEIMTMVLQGIGHVMETIGQGYRVAAGVAHVVPQFHVQGVSSGTSTGGKQVGDALVDEAEMFRLLASQFAFAANMTSTMGGYQRRKEEWDLQGNLARIDIEQIQRQIAAAEIRLALSEKELVNHEKQLEQVHEVESFLRDKFTNRELYRFMVSRLAVIHQQTYQMAYDVAKKAERAAQRDLGLEVSRFTFISFEHWDNQKKGLLSGEKLGLELRQMELAYLERNKREYELIKPISLAILAPQALLDLKQTGRCEFDLPEILFDMDYPGHYMRRIKSVSMTIPCIIGPYTAVNAVLTMNRNSYRKNNLLLGGTSIPESAGYPRQDEGGIPDPRFVDDLIGESSIATSSAQNDSGLFELNFRDERYLPFEGAGVISHWTLELDKETNRFNFSTISDVILHVRYTAQDGRDSLKRPAKAYLQEKFTSSTDAPLFQLSSVRHDFSNEWYRFLHPSPGVNVLGIHLDLAIRIPYVPGDHQARIIHLELFLKSRSPGVDGAMIAAELSRADLAENLLDELRGISDSDGRSLQGFRFDVTNGFYRSSVVIPATSDHRTNRPFDLRILGEVSHDVGGVTVITPLNPELLDDLFIICRYVLE